MFLNDTERFDNAFTVALPQLHMQYCEDRPRPILNYNTVFLM